MNKRFPAVILIFLAIFELAGCATDGTTIPAPDWKNAPNRQAG
jgi:hypothetical protein